MVRVLFFRYEAFFTILDHLKLYCQNPFTDWANTKTITVSPSDLIIHHLLKIYDGLTYIEVAVSFCFQLVFLTIVKYLNNACVHQKVEALASNQDSLAYLVRKWTSDPEMRRRLVLKERKKT